MPRRFVLTFLACMWSAASVAAEPPADQQAIDHFERKVRPLLARHCFQCHSAAQGKRKGELTVDSVEALLRGGDRGPAVVPGKPDESLLITAVRYADDDLRMPPSKQLSAREIAALETWVRQGAVFPARQPATSGVGRDFWSLQPPKKSPLPKVANKAWPLHRMDRFILRSLEADGLAPSDEADRRTLIRRAYFDLIGLPPEPAEVRAFVSDESPHAFERLVDRLLASPRYGERWGRYWLDLARYTDSTASWLTSTGQAWRYRDWVVQALNDDVPYDDFVRRQFATDMMDSTGPDDLPALGFLGLSPTYWKEPRLAPDVIKVIVAEEWEERIDAVSRTFLGLTIACARCHDHKFDPITMEDYYGLAGVFANAQLAARPMLPAAQAAAVRAAHEQVASLQEQIKKLGNSNNERKEELQKQVDDLRVSTPGYDAPVAQGVEEAAIYVLPNGPDATTVEHRAGEVRELALFKRGNPSTPGDVVPRRFVSVLSTPKSRPFKQGSGRLELANAILDEGLPLASRVIVNRVWRHHFGRGLVATPSNFGTQGDPPSHPRLLDDLAARFVDNGWSLEWLHREIMLSATYRQSSHHDERKHKLDPANRLLWRMNRRRLDIEAWRDSILRVANRLDDRIGGDPVPLDNAANRRRTLYGRIERRELNDMLRLYDFPQPTAHSPGRTLTTTPLQQLFVLNSRFVDDHAAALTTRVLGADDKNSERIRAVYAILFQREPTAAEYELATTFLGQHADDGPWRQYVHTLLGTNEFLFID